MTTWLIAGNSSGGWEAKMAETPMMRQYKEAKEACPDALLLFRMGDFYELFHEDARQAAKILHLSLTSRDKGENPIPMAGFPHHQLESYLSKLIRAGSRVAICDQVEDPKQAKGLVRREVTRIVTAGTLTDDALLEPHENNYLAAVVHDSRRKVRGKDAEHVGVAWLELSTGRFMASRCPTQRLADELTRIDPAECLMTEQAPSLPAHLADRIVATRRPDWQFSRDTAAETLSKQFGTTGVEGFGFDDPQGPELCAAAAILQYLTETQKTSLDHIDLLTPHHSAGTLQLDEATRRSLEITRTFRDGRREGSLLWVLDQTVTAMGSRLLSEWVAHPLTNLHAIEARLDSVAEFIGDTNLGNDLRELLRGVYDMERLLARVTTGRASPRDLSFLARTLKLLPAIKARVTERKSSRLRQLEERLDLCPEVRGLLEEALAEDCPLQSREGGFIRSGYREELDSLRVLAQGGKQWIAEYQREEAARTGIPTLKVGFNKVFGYYLEVTRAQSDKVPDNYIRKQTLKNAERYITPELKEYEEKVLSADDKAKSLEYDLFVQIRDQVASEVRRIQSAARVLAELDVLTSMAELARLRGYCRPAVIQEPRLDIRGGRHPVLDAMMPHGQFVPNETTCDEDAGRVLLITGPNMAGKSTYIRQVALITLMAQVGSFVPAEVATIGITDRIFARVGASDELSRGQSTFMVEMTETARILNMASPNSLVILDEIGRGTSTYDGVSLAWAVTEYLHDQIGCRTLFATHYHELAELANSLQHVTNLNVAVKEWEGNVAFLHKIIPGAADKSYGIHVARLAGVPSSVYRRAEQILHELEGEHHEQLSQTRSTLRSSKRRKDIQLTLFEAPEDPIVDELREIDLNQTTPLDALVMLRAWQERLSERGTPTKPR